ncbi:Sec-independent protein translocase protein TatCy [compost metagenome]
MDSNDWISHLTEVRKRLIIVAGWFIVTLSMGLYVSPNILRYIKSQHSASRVEWHVFSFTEGLLIYMKCALLFALLFTVPVILYQLWLFVRPGLTDTEAKSTLPYIPAAFALFLFGATFSYMVVFPMMLRFMMKMNHTVGAVETYGMGQFFSFLYEIVFPMAVAFEMPVVLLFLTRIGLLTPDRLKKTRKYTYVGMAIVGSCISPPDMISHLSVTIPLILLFEISVFFTTRQWRSMQGSPTNS